MLDAIIDLETEENRITLFGDWDREDSPAPIAMQILREFYDGKSAEQIRNDFCIGEVELYDLLRSELWVSSQVVAIYRNTLLKWRELLLIEAEKAKESVPFATDKDSAYRAGYGEGRYVHTMETVQTIIDIINQIALRTERKHETEQR